MVYRELYCLDIESGQEHWGFQLPNDAYSSPHKTQIGSQLYTYLEPPNTVSPYSVLGRFDFYGNPFDTILTVQNNGYSPSLVRPAIWGNPQSDSILIFQNRSFNFSTPDGQIDLYAVNLRTRAVEWVINDLDPSGNSSVAGPPLVYNVVPGVLQ